MDIINRALITAFSAGLALCAAAPAQDNVLIVMIDDVGVDQIGAYAEGTTPPPTPTIDGLASNGVLFRNAWSNPMCSPTRSCFLTGRHSIRTGVGHVLPGNELGLIEITIPEQLDLRNSGYAHAAVGKWHVSTGPTAPNDAGWGHFAGDLTGLNDYYNWQRTVNGVTATSTIYATTQMVDDALSWIQTQSGPWVCLLALQAAHSPYHAPPSNLHTQNLAGLDPATTPLPFFKAMIEALDSEVGRLLAGLGPEATNTNVIFCSDNGTPSTLVTPPFTTGKGSPFEGGINVPLIVSGPTVASPNREEAALTHTVDLFSTVLELAGVEPEPPFVDLDGVSLVPYLTTPGTPPLKQFVYSELFDSQAIDFSSIRNQQFKLIQYRFGETPVMLFYDLLADPFETANLLTSPLTPIQQTNFDALFQGLTTVRIPVPSFVKYGAGCQSSAGIPTVHGGGTPEPGGTYNVLLENAPAGVPAILLIGASDKYWGQLPLPFSMIIFGANPSCSWLASADLSVSLSSGTGSASFPMFIPNLSWFAGTKIRHQWLLIDQNAPNNPVGMVMTDGLTVHVGR